MGSWWLEPRGHGRHAAVGATVGVDGSSPVMLAAGLPGDVPADAVQSGPIGGRDDVPGPPADERLDVVRRDRHQRPGGRRGLAWRCGGPGGSGAGGDAGTGRSSGSTLITRCGLPISILCSPRRLERSADRRRFVIPPGGSGFRMSFAGLLSLLPLAASTQVGLDVVARHGLGVRRVGVMSALDDPR